MATIYYEGEAAWSSLADDDLIAVSRKNQSNKFYGLRKSALFAALAGTTWILGSGAPSSGTGEDGNVYLDIDTGDLYGPKASGAWGASIGSLRGPTGLQGDQGLAGNPGNDGNDGQDGTDGTDGASWIVSSGAPSSGQGSDGDFYLDSSTGDLYGPKAGGAWGASIGSLLGPQGNPGADGQDGQDGQNGTNGTNGTNGNDGADGATIRSGSGAPGAGLGNDGDYYIDTVTGDLYGPKTTGTWGAIQVNLKGPQGDQGTQGNQGETGASGEDGETPPVGVGYSGPVEVDGEYSGIFHRSMTVGEISIDGAGVSGSLEFDLWVTGTAPASVSDSVCNANYASITTSYGSVFAVPAWSDVSFAKGEHWTIKVRSTTLTEASIKLIQAS